MNELHVGIAGEVVLNENSLEELSMLSGEERAFVSKVRDVQDTYQWGRWFFFGRKKGESESIHIETTLAGKPGCHFWSFLRGFCEGSRYELALTHNHMGRTYSILMCEVTDLVGDDDSMKDMIQKGIDAVRNACLERDV